MTHYKVMITIPMTSGLPEDAAVNTWHCDALSLPGGYEDFVDELEVLYREIGDLWSTKVDDTKVRATVYRMADPTPRAPVFTRLLTGLTKGSAALPPEIAITCSFQGERTSGESQARRRGRVFLGPLSTVWTSTTDPTVAAANLTKISNAFNAFVGASDISATFDWCVYSPSDASLVPVNNGWVDNAFDVQRRRGTDPTTRSLWGL
jgi:hypothetical protein